MSEAVRTQFPEKLILCATLCLQLREKTTGLSYEKISKSEAILELVDALKHSAQNMIQFLILLLNLASVTMQKGQEDCCDDYRPMGRPRSKTCERISASMNSNVVSVKSPGANCSLKPPSTRTPVAIFCCNKSGNEDEDICAERSKKLDSYFKKDDFSNISPSDKREFEAMCDFSASNQRPETVWKFLTSFELSSLTRLYLTWGNLDSLPLEMGSLKFGLKILHLGSNRFWNIPPVVFGLRRLEELILNNNAITSDGIGPIHELQTTLTRLDLSFNRLERVPPNMYDLGKLSFLDLSHNFISRISKDVEKLKMLRSLRMKCNPMTQLPKEVALLPSIQSVCFAENMISNIPVDDFVKSRTLTYLCFHSNRLSNADQKKLEDAQHFEVRLKENAGQSEVAKHKGCNDHDDPHNNEIFLLTSQYPKDQEIVCDVILPKLSELGFCKNQIKIDFVHYRAGHETEKEFKELHRTSRATIALITKAFMDENRSEATLARRFLCEILKKPHNGITDHNRDHTGCTHHRVVPLAWRDSEDEFALPHSLTNIEVIKKEQHRDNMFWEKVAISVRNCRY